MHGLFWTTHPLGRGKVGRPFASASTVCLHASKTYLSTTTCNGSNLRHIPPLSTALDPLCPSPLWVPWCPPHSVEEVRVRLGSMGPNSIRVGSTKPYCAHRRHGRRAFLPRAVRGTRKRREKETWWKEGWTKRGTSGSTEGMERRKQERETKGDTRHWCSGACVLIDGCHRQRLETRKIRRRGSERGTTDRQVEAGGNSNPMRSPTRPRSERRQDFHQESVVPAASW